MQAPGPQTSESLERMLARYARVRLDPSPAGTRRARAAVMEEARRRRFELAGAAADVPSVSAAAPVLAPRRRLPFTGWSMRRLSSALSAAVLAGLLVGTTAFATSRAGGPLYEARLALETLTLPSDAAARVEAEIAIAQSRLAEIVEASSRDDQGALSASLTAYEHAIGSLGATTGEAAARAMEAVASHRAVLERVAGKVPQRARSGLDHALAAGDTVVDKLSGAGDRKPGGGAGNGKGNENGVGSGNGAGNGKGNENGVGTPGVTPATEPTQKPARTPPPKPTKGPVDPGGSGKATP